MRFLLTIALLLAAVPAWAQSVKLPAEIRGAVGAWIIVAPEEIDGGAPKWRVDSGLQEVRLDLLFPPELVSKAKGKVLTSTVPGRYRVEAWNAKGDVASEIATCLIVIGDPPPTPTPVPVPTPTPEPTPNPTPAGPRTVLIFRESASDTPAQARMFTSLQAGQASKYLKDKGHVCFVLDVDAKDADGRPAAIIARWLPHIQGVSLPALVILDKSGSIVAKASLPESAVADDVLTVLKNHGG